MRRATSLTFLTLLAGGAALVQVASAQVTEVSVSLNLTGPVFVVDGQRYNTPQVFFWPQGSKHTVQFLATVDESSGQPLPYQGDNGDDTRWTFSGWTDNLGSLTQPGAISEVVTVVPGLSSITGQVTTSYAFSLEFGSSTLSCSDALGPKQNPAGVVYINGTCFTGSSVQYLPAGTVTLNAFAYPGYAFAGWTIGGNPFQFARSFVLTGPTAIIPNFRTAKRVSFRTDPPALQVIVDHSLITTPPAVPSSIPPPVNVSTNCQPDYTTLPTGAPSGVVPLCVGDFDFLPGSVHQIGAPTPQKDAGGVYWVFSKFSDGIAQNGNYVTDDRPDLPDTVTADFVRGVQAVILTNPAGLKVQVDGSDSLLPKTFEWGAGETHHLNAPLTQTDSHGRAWQFVKWSNGAPAAQDVTAPTDSSGLALTATYQLLGQVQITSAPAGLSFTVDGSPCTTPCAVNRPSGTQIQVSAPSSVPTAPGTRYDFDGWAGGAATTALSVTFNQDAQSFTANYHVAYLLATSSNPENGATFTFNPSSPDGYFPAGTQATVTATAKGGYKFIRWEGAFEGYINTAYVTMSGPRSVVADLNSFPYIAPGGIVNSAGPTPDGAVSPGSLISIYGANLAGDLQVGPGDPLAESIGGVSVTVDNEAAPLLFISPQQINAQLPSDLGAGSHMLTVHDAGQPDVSQQIAVARNAPGIYEQPGDTKIPLALAVHQDGTLITADSPARRNEIISIYANGLGPFDSPAPDGLPIPTAHLWTAADPVSVAIGDSLTLSASWAGAAPDMVGTDIVQLKIEDKIPAATTVNLVVTANGKASSAVQLPVE